MFAGGTRRYEKTGPTGLTVHIVVYKMAEDFGFVAGSFVDCDFIVVAAEDQHSFFVS